MMRYIIMVLLAISYYLLEIKVKKRCAMG